MTLSKQALQEALARPHYDRLITQGPIIEAAARFVERLLPEKCGICGGGGHLIPDGVTKQVDYGRTCDFCHGDGQLWDEGLIEVVAEAIYKTVGLTTPWVELEDAHKEPWEEDAQAVLAALAGKVGE